MKIIETILTIGSIVFVTYILIGTIHAYMNGDFA